MKRTRLALALTMIATAALFTALPAAGKEGVKATLTTRVPVATPAGTPLRIGWTLRTQDGHLFGGGDIFVRLLSATHAGPRTTYVSCSGRCSAVVRVPEGGMRGIQIGIRGGGGRGYHLFPITNNPLG